MCIYIYTTIYVCKSFQHIYVYMHIFAHRYLHIHEHTQLYVVKQTANAVFFLERFEDWIYLPIGGRVCERRLHVSAMKVSNRPILQPDKKTRPPSLTSILTSVFGKDLERYSEISFVDCAEEHPSLINLASCWTQRIETERGKKLFDDGHGVEYHLSKAPAAAAKKRYHLHGLCRAWATCLVH